MAHIGSVQAELFPILKSVIVVVNLKLTEFVQDIGVVIHNEFQYQLVHVHFRKQDHPQKNICPLLFNKGEGVYLIVTVFPTRPPGILVARVPVSKEIYCPTEEIFTYHGFSNTPLLFI